MKKQVRFSNVLWNFGLYGVLAVLSIFFAFPLIFMLVSSFKVNPEQALHDASTLKAFLPYGQLGFRNYVVVLRSSDLVRFLLNSLFVGGTTVFSGLLVNSTLAYSLARRRWKGSRIILILIIALMIVPFNAISMPLLLLVNWFGWLDTYQVQIVPFIATPLYIFLFYQFFINLPKDYSDAAVIDGANPLQIFWYVILPLSRQVIAIVTILNFLACWSAYLWPLITIRSPNYYPLMIGVSYMSHIGGRAVSGVAMAYFVMVSVPVFVLFILFQKWFMKSAMLSGMMSE